MILKYIIFIALAIVAIEAAKKSDIGSGKGKKAREEATALADDLKKGGKGKSKQNGNGNSLEQKSSVKDDTGVTVTRMAQKYKGVRVIGGEVISMDVPEGEVTLQDKSGVTKRNGKQKRKKQTIMAGIFVEDLSDDIGEIDSSKFNTKKAEQTVRNMLKGKQGAESADASVEPVVYVAEEGKAKLAYLVDIDLPEIPSRPQIVVDEDGNKLAERNIVYTAEAGVGPGGNQKTGMYQYDGTTGYNNNGGSKLKAKLHVTEDGTVCTFQGPDLLIVNLAGKTDFNTDSNTPFSYTCYNQTGDQVNGGYSPLNDLNFGVNTMVKMFQTWYKRQPLPKTKPIVANAHYGTATENAFWNGYYNELMIGDGATYFYPLTSLDVVCHEVGHGVTSQSSNLDYSDGSDAGGLNEAFSDMTGLACVFFSEGSTNFKIGDRLTKTMGQLRCMDNPPCDGRSIDHVSKMTPTIDPHYSSGVFNKVFYHLSTTLQYGVWDAYDIMYFSNTAKWTSTTTFLQAAEAMMTVTDEMIAGGIHGSYTYSWIQPDQVKAALAKVGINCDKSTGSWACTK